MNYFLLALALATAAIALLYSFNIVRVALGQVQWASNAAAIVHIIVAPAAIALTVWIFGLAVA